MREGLMDDTGYHGYDDAEFFAEKYCQRCKNQPIVEENGKLLAVDCDKDCSLADPEYFEEDDDDTDDTDDTGI